jgi:hypothetical protein
MVKDSRKYAATGGWGFAQFKNGKPDSGALLKTCFPCHEPVKARDFIFTHYALIRGSPMKTEESFWNSITKTRFIL